MTRSLDDKKSFFQELLDERAGACFVFDFDGTLAPIVIDPTTAAVSQPLIEPLRALSQRAAIKIISGRPVDFLCEKLFAVFPDEGDSIEIFGKYGIERGTLRDGVTSTYQVDTESLAQLRSLQLAMEAVMPERCFIEYKGTSTGYHFRSNPTQQSHVRNLIDENIKDLSLDKVEVHDGKMVFEVMVSGVPTKGASISIFREDFRGIFFAGDDLGDVDAFKVITDLQAPRGLSVLVRGSAETESRVGSSVDLIAEDQVQLAELICELLGRSLVF